MAAIDVNSSRRGPAPAPAKPCSRPAVAMMPSLASMAHEVSRTRARKRAHSDGATSAMAPPAVSLTAGVEASMSDVRATRRQLERPVHAGGGLGDIPQARADSEVAGDLRGGLAARLAA
jgi:hypothetical protein